MSNTLFVGIDISMKKATCCLLNQNGELLKNIFEVDNNISGFQELQEQIDLLIPTNRVNLVYIGLEATSMYGFHLLDYFSSTTFKYPVEIKLYQVNAKYVSRFKKAFPEKEKTDITDCRVIAEYLRFGRLPAEYKPECLFLPLRRLVRYRYHLVKQLEKEKKLYLANLFLKFPGWVQNRPIGQLGKTAMDVTGEFTPDQLAEIPLEELALFVAKAGKNRSPDPTAIAEEIQKAARESYRIRPDLASSITFILASISKTISTLKDNLKQLDKAISEEAKGFINPLVSIKGIGPVYSAGILACIGDIKRFPSHDQLARYAGLVWKRRQTGNTESEQKRIVRECDNYLRYYLVESANSLRMHNEIYRTFYQKKYQEVPNHKHKRALMLTARKLVRLVFALLSNNQLYDPLRETQSPRLPELNQNCQRAI